MNLEITRKDEWVNRFRSIDLYMNDTKIGKIEHNQVIKTELPEGDYYLRAKLDWTGSKVLHINSTAGAIAKVEVSSFLYSNNWLYRVVYSFILLNIVLGFVLVPFGFQLPDVVNITLAVVSGVTILFFAYMLTIGRNRYLRLRVK